MSRSRSAVVLAMMLVAVLATLVLWTLAKVRERRSDHDQPSSQVAATSEAAERAGDQPRTRERSLARLRTYLRGARTLVPRGENGLPSVTPDAGGAAAAVHHQHPRRLDPGGGSPRDRRPGDHADSQKLRDELSARMKQANEAAEKCLDDWAQVDDSLDQGVMLALSVDTQGLQEVTIEDRAEVPSGPLKCIADSVYPIDWGGLTESPLKLTVPVRYQRPDAASPDYDASRR